MVTGPDDHEAGQEIVAQARTGVRRLGRRVERQLGELGLQVDRLVLRELGQLRLASWASSWAWRGPDWSDCSCIAHGSRLSGLASLVRRIAHSRLQDMQMRGQIRFRAPLSREMVPTQGRRKSHASDGARGALGPLKPLELLGFFVDGGAYWATTRQSMPVPFSLAQAAWPSCALANGPNAHPVERAHVADHRLVDLGLARRQGRAVLALDLGPRGPAPRPACAPFRPGCGTCLRAWQAATRSP